MDKMPNPVEVPTEGTARSARGVVYPASDPKRAAVLYCAPPAVFSDALSEGQRGKVAAKNASTKKVVLKRLDGDAAQRIDIRRDSVWCTEKDFVGPGREREDATWLAKVTVNALRDAGPHLIEAIVKDNDAPWCERFPSYRQVVSGGLSGMAAIDTDEPVRASRESFERRAIERSTVALMYDKTPHIGIGMPSDISSKLIKIAGAGVVDVACLICKQINRDCALLPSRE
jgi:hypothetical protein